MLFRSNRPPLELAKGCAASLFPSHDIFLLLSISAFLAVLSTSLLQSSTLGVVSFIPDGVCFSKASNSVLYLALIVSVC